MGLSDQFEFQRVLGRGSFGVASLVWDRPARSYRVAKEIHIGKTTSLKAQQTAENEVEVLKGLSHTNVVKYCDSFIEDGTFCIIMEYADGGDLSAAIVRQRALKQRFRTDEVVAILMQCAKALNYIHLRNVVHRDVKSQNVFLTSSGEVKLGDFGVARVLDTAADLALTAIGTPSHLAPEVCHGEAYGTKADMWSFGVVAFEVLALEAPFQADNILALVSRITTAEPKVVPREPYDDDLWGLVRRLLRKVPEERPSASGALSSSALRRGAANAGALAKGCAAIAAIAAGDLNVAGEAMALASKVVKPAWPEEAVDSLDSFVKEHDSFTSEDTEVSEAFRRELGLPEPRTPDWALQRRSPAAAVAAAQELRIDSRDSLDDLLSGVYTSSQTDVPDSMSSRSSTASCREGGGARIRPSSTSLCSTGRGLVGLEMKSEISTRLPQRDRRLSQEMTAKPSIDRARKLTLEDMGRRPSIEKSWTPGKTLSVQGLSIALSAPIARAPCKEVEDYPRLLGRRRRASVAADDVGKLPKVKVAPAWPARQRSLSVCA